MSNSIAQIPTVDSRDEAIRIASDKSAVPSLVRFQALIGLALLTVMIGPFVAADLLARSDTVAYWLSVKDLESSQRTHRLFVNRGAYFDTGDKMLFHDLPRADYSKGGVYLFGSSAAMYCLDDYHFSSEQARIIHNYAVYGMNDKELNHFLRFLVDYNGLLSAGGDKTMVMIGLAYTDVVEPPRLQSLYFPRYFTRAGVFRYDFENGVIPVPMTGIERFVRTEYARGRSFILRLTKIPDDPPHRLTSFNAFRERATERLGADWQGVMDRQIPQLANTLDYLKSLNVHVVGVLLPEGTWHDGMPAHEEFLARVKPMFAQKDVPLLDYSHLLVDGDFTDDCHNAPSGTKKIQAALLRQAAEFLHRGGKRNGESGPN